MDVRHGDRLVMGLVRSKPHHRSTAAMTPYRPECPLRYFDCAMPPVHARPVGRRSRKTASLQQAIERSVAYAMSNAVVVAICRLPSDNIIVFRAQIERLRETITARELVPIERTYFVA